MTNHKRQSEMADACGWEMISIFEPGATIVLGRAYLAKGVFFSFNRLKPKID